MDCNTVCRPLIIYAVTLWAIRSSDLTGWEFWTDPAVPCNEGGAHCTSCLYPVHLWISHFPPLLHALELQKGSTVLLKHT